MPSFRCLLSIPVLAVTGLGLRPQNKDGILTETKCVGVGVFDGSSVMDAWCTRHCITSDTVDRAFCPRSSCRCEGDKVYRTCSASPDWAQGAWMSATQENLEGEVNSEAKWETARDQRMQTAQDFCDKHCTSDRNGENCPTDRCICSDTDFDKYDGNCLAFPGFQRAKNAGDQFENCFYPHDLKKFKAGEETKNVMKSHEECEKKCIEDPTCVAFDRNEDRREKTVCCLYNKKESSKAKTFTGKYKNRKCYIKKTFKDLIPNKLVSGKQ